MQFNSIIMALAGAERVFKLLDEKPETDEGYVMLVNCEYDENGNVLETEKHTGHWAWKHYHKQSDHSTTYQKLEGDVTFNHVDFGYRDDKMVLHDIVIHAKPGEKVALVGSTGAGKTTITNLINRFYDIQDGKIRYDNINVNKIKKADLVHGNCKGQHPVREAGRDRGRDRGGGQTGQCGWLYQKAPARL